MINCINISKDTHVNNSVITPALLYMKDLHAQSLPIAELDAVHHHQH